MVPEIAIQVIAAVSGTIVSIGIPLILSKINKLSRLQTTVFGVEDVESMGGLVGVVETHEQDIRELEDRQLKIEENQTSVKEAVTDVRTRVNNLEEKVQDRRSRDND